MTTHEFLGIYDAKVMEYLLAVCYLLLFVPMWRYVQAGRPLEARAGAAVGAGLGLGLAPALAAPAAVAAGWFHAPAGVELHPGHAWARLEGDGLVTVGLDDFAQKLVDPERLVLPRAGDEVLQGRPAFAVGDQVLTVPMLSPVDGTVVAVNTAARDRPEALRDPYGAGWLFKVRAPHLEENRRQLFSGERAGQWLERTAEALSLRMSPALGHVLQDGGTPVPGIARALAGERWADLARHFLLTERSEP
ncbi:MAG: glycine cleavage system protein H [Anaeromyxobacter sp.]|nr:glycine cleavage system protein H [Anaeromyxobacter sp.]MBL0277172.1 glycine cleavage system protein H [Anaeromyxobacter sp.]